MAWSKINNSKYKNILCSISGGSDSDVMLDIVWRCDKDNKVTKKYSEKPTPLVEREI